MTLAFITSLGVIVGMLIPSQVSWLMQRAEEPSDAIREPLPQWVEESSTSPEDLNPAAEEFPTAASTPDDAVPNVFEPPSSEPLEQTSPVPKNFPPQIAANGQVTSSAETAAASTLPVQLYQQWQLQPGDEVAGYLVTSGLGDIAVDLKGAIVRAPFAGEVKLSEQPECVFFQTPEVPAYLFRLCGLQQPQIGWVPQGEAIASADLLAIAVLRKQPSGDWAMVEPSIQVIEQWLAP
jgi:hypothetical protein